MARAIYIGKKGDASSGFEAAGLEVVLASDRAEAIDALRKSMDSREYAFILVGDPWSSELADELTGAMRESAVPILLLRKGLPYTKPFASLVSRMVGSRNV